MNIAPVTSTPDVTSTPPRDIVRIGSLRHIGIRHEGFITPLGVDFHDRGRERFPNTPVGMADAVRAAQAVSRRTGAAALIDVIHGGEFPSQLTVRKLIDMTTGPNFGTPFHLGPFDESARFVTIDHASGPLVDGDVVIESTGTEDLDGNEVRP